MRFPKICMILMTSSILTSMIPVNALQAYGIYGSERCPYVYSASADSSYEHVTSSEICKTMYLTKDSLVFEDDSMKKTFGILQKGQSVGLISKDEKTACVRAGFRKGYVPLNVLTDTKPEASSEKPSETGKVDQAVNDALEDSKKDLASKMSEDEIPDDLKSSNAEDSSNESTDSSEESSDDVTDHADKDHTIAIVRNGKVVYTTLEKAHSKRGIIEDSDVEITADENTEETSEAASENVPKTVLSKDLGRNEEGPNGVTETFYDLDMSGVVSIMRNLGYSENDYPYSVRDDGVKLLGKYVMVAADLHKYPRGSFVNTSLGRGIVCDTGDFATNGSGVDFDIAVNW